mmetsp:Transcript_4160/g.7074  ORF Transcript_4160/g.7074 Transcript_4160/m.7074 type:complete len:290 (+) Transcript_4160:289-1158(+)
MSDGLGRILSEISANCLSHGLDRALLGGAHVVNLPNHTLVKDLVECAGHVPNVQVAARVLAVSVDRQQAALFREKHELRDELLGVLLWAVYVVAPRGDHWELVRGVVRLDQHLSPRLGGCVGIGGLQGMALMVTNLHTHRGLAVHLICADVDETLDAPHDARSFQQHMRAEDVVHGEVKAVPERIVHVRLGGEVHNRIDLLSGEQVIYKIRAGDVSLDELEVRTVFHGIEVLHAGAVVQLVQHHHLVLRVGPNEKECNMARNEPCSAGQQDVLWDVVRRHDFLSFSIVA